MNVRGRPKSGSFVRPSTPAIGTMPIDNAYRAMVTQGSALLLAGIVKYHIGQGRKQWEAFK